MGGPQSFLFSLGLGLDWGTSQMAAPFCHPPTPGTQPRFLAFLKLLPIFLISLCLLVSPFFQACPPLIVFSANKSKDPFYFKGIPDDHSGETKLKALSMGWSRAARLPKELSPCLCSPNSGLSMVFSSLSVELRCQASTLGQALC